MDTVVKLIQGIVNAATPEIRELLTNFIRDLDAHAAETPNPWDNLLVAILKTICNID